MNLILQWKRFWFSSPLDTGFYLGLARWVIFGFCLLRETPFQASYFVAERFQASWQPVGVFSLLPGPLSASVLECISWLWLPLIVLSMTGLMTSWSTKATFACGLIIFGYDSNFGKIYHGKIVLLLSIALMAMSHCGDRLSLDSWIRSIKNQTRSLKERHYQWSLKMGQLILVSSYFSAGIQKLVRGDGFLWAFSDNLALRVFESPTQTWLGQAFLQWPPILQKTIALGALGFELLSPLVLFFPPLTLPFLIGVILFHSTVHYLFGGHTGFFTHLAGIAFFLAYIPGIDRIYRRLCQSKVG